LRDRLSPASFPEPEVAMITPSLLQVGHANGICLYPSLFFNGTRFGSGLAAEAPKKTWCDVLIFIFKRFKDIAESRLT